MMYIQHILHMPYTQNMQNIQEKQHKVHIGNIVRTVYIFLTVCAVITDWTFHWLIYFRPTFIFT